MQNKSEKWEETEQDEMVELFVGWVSRPADDPLSKFGKAFVQWLCGRKIAIARIKNLRRQRKTKNCIFDVYFEIEVRSGQKIRVVVENKVDAWSKRGEQLAKYRDAIDEEIAQSGRDESRKLVYFKTGYILPDEKLAADEAEFEILDLESVLAFLKSWQRLNDGVVHKNFQRLKKVLREREEAFAKMDFSSPDTRFKVMRDLQKNLEADEGWVDRSLHPKYERAKWLAWMEERQQEPDYPKRNRWERYWGTPAGNWLLWAEETRRTAAVFIFGSGFHITCTGSCARHLRK